MVTIVAAVAVVGALLNELLSLGLAEDGYPALAATGPLEFGGFLLRAGAVLAVSVALNILLERLEGGPVDPG